MVRFLGLRGFYGGERIFYLKGLAKWHGLRLEVDDFFLVFLSSSCRLSDNKSLGRR